MKERNQILIKTMRCWGILLLEIIKKKKEILSIIYSHTRAKGHMIFIVYISDSIGLNSYCGLQELLKDSFIQIISLLGKELNFNFRKLKELNVILFEMSTREFLLLFCGRERQNIIIDGFV